MNQLKLMLSRLRRPSVLVSVVSQIVTILILFNIKVDMSLVTGILTAVTSILVMLGILSNPDTKTPGYEDDFKLCANCHKNTRHVLIGENLVCGECGSVNHTASGAPVPPPAQ